MPYISFKVRIATIKTWSANTIRHKNCKTACQEKTLPLELIILYSWFAVLVLVTSWYFFHELFSNVWSSRSKSVIHYKIFSLNFVWFKNVKIDILLVWVKKSSQDLVNRFKLLSIFLSFLFPATGALNWVATRWVQNIFNSVRNQTTCFRNGSTTCFQVSERTWIALWKILPKISID